MYKLHNCISIVLSRLSLVSQSIRINNVVTRERTRAVDRCYDLFDSQRGRRAIARN